MIYQYPDPFWDEEGKVTLVSGIPEASEIGGMALLECLGSKRG